MFKLFKEKYLKKKYKALNLNIILCQPHKTSLGYEGEVAFTAFFG